MNIEQLKKATSEAFEKAAEEAAEKILKECPRKEVKEEPEPWKPKAGDKYWYIRQQCCLTQIANNSADAVIWADDVFDQSVNEIGNVFRTKDEAEKAVEWLKARKVLFDDTKGFKPNWENANETKWVVYYEVRNGRLCTEWGTRLVYSGPYFATKEDAEASIKAHEKEWKIYLLGSDSND